jgi:hypothetical protein
MELEGKLATFPLGDVLKFVEEKGHTGCLSVRLEMVGIPHLESILGKTLEETLSIREGRLAGLGSLDYFSTWANVLVRRGLVTRWETRELRRRIPGQGEMLYELIAAALDLPQEQVLKGAEFHMEEVAGWLFTGREGDFSFRFVEDIPTVPGLDNIPLSELIEKGREGSETLKALFECYPQPGTILVPVLPPEDDPPPVLEPDEWEMMARVDGRRYLYELLASSPFPCHVAAALLGSILEKRVVAPGASAERTASPLSGSWGETGPRWGGILKKIFSGRKEQETLPNDSVGQYAVALNRLSEKIREPAARTLETAWRGIQSEFPGARILDFEEGLFDPDSFANNVAVWGNHPGYWDTVRRDCEEALLRFLARIVREIRSVDGRKKAEALFRKAAQGIGGLEGFSAFEELD